MRDEAYAELVGSDTDGDLARVHTSCCLAKTSRVFDSNMSLRTFALAAIHGQPNTFRSSCARTGCSFALSLS